MRDIGDNRDWVTTGADGTVSRRVRRQAIQRRRRSRLLARAAVLIAAIALPTVAAQGEWTEFRSALGLGDETVAIAPMPFETPGQSFPGSAFYYLEEAPDLALAIDELRGDGERAETMTFAAGHGRDGVPRAFRSTGTGIDKARALQCLSMAVYYEAASESLSGQQAVAQVVLNRVAHPTYPASVCGVVFQGSERATGCQFTFTCDGSLTRRPSRAGWARAQSVALAALSGSVFEPIGLATHYHTHSINPYWAASLDLVGSVGAHRFYRWKGSAGEASAFSIDYRGGEPSAAPKRRPAKRQTPGAFEPASITPPPNSALASAPAPGPGPEGPDDRAEGSPAPGSRLPQSGRVRPEYARSGRWLKEPGSTD